MSKAIKRDHCFFIVSFSAFSFCWSQASFLLHLFKRSWRRWTKLIANPGPRGGIQRLGFASSSQILCIPLWPNNDKDEIQKLYYSFFSYLNVGKGCASTFLDPRREKSLQSSIALHNIIWVYPQLSILEIDIFNFPLLRGAKNWQEPHRGAGSTFHLPQHEATETQWMPFCTGEEI